MKNVLIIAALALVAWFAYTRTIAPAPVEQPEATSEEYEDDGGLDYADTTPQFRCDGRIYCSEMTSCEEAEFFLRNCPGVKMDGNNDGEPCEKQWCGNAR